MAAEFDFTDVYGGGVTPSPSESALSTSSQRPLEKQRSVTFDDGDESGDVYGGDGDGSGDGSISSVYAEGDMALAAAFESCTATSESESITLTLESEAPSPASPADALEFSASTQTKLRRQSSSERVGRVRVGSTDSLDFKVSPNDFELLTVIGQGAYGRVFQVRESQSGAIYAMKVLQKGQVLQKNNLSYVREERNILCKANHPFVVTLMCAFQSQDKLYLVMEYVCGGELFSHLRDEGLFDEAQARYYAAEMVLALEYLHLNGIIHRDLKPENVLLDEFGHIRITDFGLATENRQESKTLCGTDLYMAPEMIAGRGYGKAVDFWSLGAILFEMLTGDTPFYAKDTKRLYRRILTSKPRFPRWLSKGCIALLKGLLNRNVEQRLGAAESSMFKVRGITEVKDHEFFTTIDWQRLGALEIEPPFRPTVVGGLGDTSNFAETFTNMKPNHDLHDVDGEELEEYARHLEKATMEDFAGFSFTHPTYLEKAMTFGDNADDPNPNDAFPPLAARRKNSSKGGAQAPLIFTPERVLVVPKTVLASSVTSSQLPAPMPTPPPSSSSTVHSPSPVPSPSPSPSPYLAALKSASPPALPISLAAAQETKHHGAGEVKRALNPAAREWRPAF